MKKYFAFVYKNLFLPDKKFVFKTEKTVRIFCKIYSIFTRKRVPIAVMEETNNIHHPYKVVEWIVPYAYDTELATEKLEKVGEIKDRNDVESIEELSEVQSNIIISLSNKNERTK